MLTSRQRSKAKLTHHHEHRFPGGAPAGRSRAGGPPRSGIPGREFPGDPKEEIHCWMTNLWAREHELDEPRPALTEVEELRELVLHLRGVVEGPGNASSSEDASYRTGVPSGPPDGLLDGLN